MPLRLLRCLAVLLLFSAGAADAQAQLADVRWADGALLDGRVLKASELTGRTVVVEFWASWCPFCARQNPLLEKLHRELGPQGVVFLGINIDREQKNAAEMVKRHTEGWGVGRHVLGSNYFRYVRDPWGSFAEYSYDIDFIPATIDWPAKDHPREDSFYVWGPPVPDYFIVNHESAAGRQGA